MARVAQFPSNEGTFLSIDATGRVITLSLSTTPKTPLIDLKFGPAMIRRLAAELVRAAEHAEKQPPRIKG